MANAGFQRHILFHQFQNRELSTVGYDVIEQIRFNLLFLFSQGRLSLFSLGHRIIFIQPPAVHILFFAILVQIDQCGRLLRPNYVTEHFSWIIEKYGLRKIRFHDLRHTCASLLLNSGENITMKQIQIWLGHSTYSTTADIYAHLDHNAQQAPANTMNGMFIRGAKDCAVQPI